jgi:Undecaprenyl-phosphate glucose phosphotransferase
MRPARLAPVRARLSSATLARAFRRLDTAALSAAAVICCLLGEGQPVLAQPLGAVLPLVAGVAAGVAAVHGLGAYAFRRSEPFVFQLTVALAGGAAAAVVAWGVDAVVPLTSATRAVALWAWLAPATLIATHIFAGLRVRGWRRAGRLTPNIVVVGATESAARLIERALETGDAAVLGVFDDRASRVTTALHGVPVLGSTAQLVDHALLPYVDRIVITLNGAGRERVRGVIDRLRLLPNAVTLLLDTAGGEQEAAIGRLFDVPLGAGVGPQARQRQAGAKRAQDILFSLLLLIPALPVMAVTALAVRLDSPGPILFRQRRHGFNNEPITVWKFRSMRQETADPHATRQVAVGDERVTRVGRFIRRTSLDELPQLFNVLSGEMSLVGPRPHAIGMQTAGEDSARLVDEYAWRHRIKPGLTGWAQINGSRGPVHTGDDVRRRVALDIDYIERQSFWFDLYILVMTLPRLLGDGDAVR